VREDKEEKKPKKDKFDEDSRRGYTPSPQELTLSQLQSAIYLRDRHDEIDD
jgi:hypothetical protein